MNIPATTTIKNFGRNKMEIIFNKNCVETKQIDGEPCILIKELIELAGVHFTQIYQKLRNKYSLHKYLRGGSRNRCITLEGCIKVLESFREPNDALINEIKNTLERFDIKEPEFEKKIPAEQLIDLEMKRLDNEKLDFKKLEEKIGKLEDNLNFSNISTKQYIGFLEDKIFTIDDKISDIENNLGQLNDKPNQKDTSFRTLLKECIKEIIREELTNE